jgi:hypothetical protein
MNNPDLGCQCESCKELFRDDGYKHQSDCAMHNMPAYPNKECDCTPVFTAYTEMRFSLKEV